MEKTAIVTTEGAQAIWSRALDLVRDHISPSSFEMWFLDVRALDLRGGVLRVAAPSDYVRSWVTKHYLELVTRSATQAHGAPLKVELTIEEREEQPTRSMPSADPEPAPPHAPGPAPGAAVTTFPERFTFETFVLGPSNRFAHAAAMAAAEAPATAYNPLFVYGGVGLGKTHLLYAIGSYISQTSGLATKYVTSESFITEFIRSVREGQGYAFQRRFRNVDVLLVDDIQFLGRAEETQTEFFHTFNELYRNSKQIVIASDRPPQELSGLEDRLRSRFRAGLCVDVQPPDLETRIAILQMKAQRDGNRVDDAVLHFIAEKFDSNIRELEGALVRVVAFAKLAHMHVDVAAAERALEGLMPQPEHELSPDAILSETAAYFNLRREDLYSKSRSRPLTNARQIAMYLMREFTGLSLIKIGELFDRDHTTALHGIKKIEGLMSDRDVTYRQVQELTKIIKSARGNL